MTECDILYEHLDDILEKHESDKKTLDELYIGIFDAWDKITVSPDEFLGWAMNFHHDENGSHIEIWHSPDETLR